MSADRALNIFSIPVGLPFLPELVRQIRRGRFHGGMLADDPIALADMVIYVPTRRAARELRSLFVTSGGSASAILPTIRPLGEFDEDRAFFEEGAASSLDLAPALPPLDRLMLLAPLVQQWIRRLPAHLAGLYGEDVVVPTSSADAIWLARDLAELMDEVETEGADWSLLKDLVPAEIADWWQVTLTFLKIVTEIWPDMLHERHRSNPAAHRNATILAEAARLRNNPPQGPVIAAGSTGSIPATAELLRTIAGLPLGAVVLPGLDLDLDAKAWAALSQAADSPSVYGHPQYQLRKLLDRFETTRDGVAPLGEPDPALALRARVLSEAMRPAENTEDWARTRQALAEGAIRDAFAGVGLIEAPNERAEALAIALAMREALEVPEATAALVTTDRTLARRVCTELARFGIVADDSGGTPLAQTPPARLLLQAVHALFSPGDPVAILSLLKHPLLSLGLDRAQVRVAAEAIELVVLRGGTGRPDICNLADLLDRRLETLDADPRKPIWWERLDEERIACARTVAEALCRALEPLAELRRKPSITVAEASHVSTAVLEALGIRPDRGLAELYAGDNGAALAKFLRNLVGTVDGFVFPPADWPGVLDALIAPEVVKPSVVADHRVSIWGSLEARLQTVDLLVIGALNEGTWPRRTDPDRFLSRGMKTGLSLEPPERRIGQAAHDFMMAMGNGRVMLARAARAGDAPSVTSRWLQRLTTFLGKEQVEPIKERGRTYLNWATLLDEHARIAFAARPEPKPPLAARPRSLSVTEVETLRRDPYAVYARRILRLEPLEPFLRDPNARERGNLVHDILERFTRAGMDIAAPDALERLRAQARIAFDEAALPADVDAIWWPRFCKLARRYIEVERERFFSKSPDPKPELKAIRTPIGATGVTLSGRADRIDLLAARMADIIDYKTGANPSRRQAHTLVAPQLALEAALLKRGAFEAIGPREPSDLIYIRLKGNGEVFEDSILELKGAKASIKSAPDLAEDAWARLERLVAFYLDSAHGFKSRLLPFREHDASGDYDHLARVLEWSAGGDGEEGEP